MLARTVFLLSASLAMALPLKKGRTWTWQMTNQTAGTLDWCTAKVLDSTRSDSGTVWRLQVRDSTSGGQDTAKLLAYRDGRQNWISLSRFIPWDPAPYTATDSIRLANPLQDTSTLPFGYGFCGLAISADSGWGSWLSGLTRLDSNSSWQTYSCRTENGSRLLEFPKEEWNSQTDYLRGQLLPDYDWLLVLKDGTPLSTPKDSLILPAPGDSLSWTFWAEHRCGYVNTTNTGTISWTFLDSRHDSSGWQIVPVRQTIDETFSQSTYYGINNSSLVTWGIGTQITSNLIVQKASSLILRDSTFLDARIAGSWRLGWSDSILPAGRYRVNSTTWIGTGYFTATTLERLDGTLDSASMSALNVYEPECGYSDTSSGYLLFSINGVQVHPEVGIRQSPRARVISSLQELVVLHPSLPIRWRDVRGRSGQIPAATLLHGDSASGLLFLDATLPDGSRWSGSWLATRR
ncbi:MAG TPA: hypothetical protein VN931_12410 [Fibrobacteria bacterium]|nr:hypothetical protein [Fibrobacteria bacterium]